MADAPQFWIDVGGTFTDCILREPAGELRRHKLLSSGKTPGAAAAGSHRREIFDPTRRRDPLDVWVGYRLRLVDAAGRCLAGAGRRVRAARWSHRARRGGYGEKRPAGK